MIAKILCSTMFLFLFSLPTLAQGRFEIQPFVGGKFGGSIPVGTNDFNINTINFRSSVSAGVTVDYNVTENFALEFLWDRQPTQVFGKLNGGGENPQQFDATLDQFHGNFIINFNPDEKFRPFLLFGMGATRASGGGDSRSEFSFGLGGGIKYFFTDRMGVRVQGRYTPTYLYSTPGGAWCNWWGACWIVPNNHYTSQFEVTAGWIFTF